MSRTFHPARKAAAVLVSLLALLVLSPALAQPRSEYFHRSETAVKASEHRLLSTARVTPMSVDAERFIQTATSTMTLRSVPISPERSVTMNLTEFSVVAADAQLQYTDDAGAHPLAPLSVRTYRGTIVGDQGSEVYLAVARHSVFGLVSTAGTTYQIATNFSEKPGDGTLAAFAVPIADLPEQKLTCGLRDVPFTADELAAMDAAAADDPCPQILYTLRGAFDADFEFYTEWDGEGGRDACADYMVSLIASMSTIYERDAQVMIAIGFLNIWTTANDPYTQTAFMPIALDEAQGYWAGGGPGPVDRSFVQVFSAKNWTEIIGIARGFDLICDDASGITFQLAKRLDPVGSVATIAHELGHIMGLRHTHSCTWNPHIDECAPAESGNCFTGTTLTEGTIMSYCKQKLMKIHDRQVPYLRTRVPTWASCAARARKLELQKPYIAFPTVNIGEPIDTTFHFFFQNRGDAPINVSRMELSGDVGNQYELISPVAPFVVPSCDSIPLRLKFKAEISAAALADLVIFHDAHNATIASEPKLVVKLEGYAKDDRPFFAFMTGGNKEINFRRVRVSTKVDSVFAAPRQLFMNIGAAPLHVDSTVIEGPDRLEFKLLEGSGPFDLLPGRKRAAAVRFAPLSSGDKLAYLVVYSNSKDRPIDSLPLKGKADPGAVLEMRVADRVIDFGYVRSGRTYDTTFDNFFFNSGTEPLEVSTTIVGANADYFAGSNWFETVEPGEGLPLQLAFHADTLTPWDWKTAYLIVATNTPKELDTVRLMARVFATLAVDEPDAADASFSIVPNPTLGAAEIMVLPAAGEAGAEYTLRIVDATGREVRRESGRFTDDGLRSRVQRGSLADGVYIVTVSTDRGTRSRTLTIAK